MASVFEDCVARGGKVRVLQLPGNMYIHTCEIDGKSSVGTPKTRKPKKYGQK